MPYLSSILGTFVPDGGYEVLEFGAYIIVIWKNMNVR